VTLTLTDWRAHEKRIDAEQPREGVPLLDLLTPEAVDALTPAEALALKYAAAAYLRPPQMVDDADAAWLAWVFMSGRGFGKTYAAAAWLMGRVLERDAGDYALVAPRDSDVWDLQWRTMRELVPPWVRVIERVARGQIVFPDHGVTLLVHSAVNVEYRGPNLRGAWCEEPVKWVRGEVLWKNLRLALRVKGATPPRAVFTTTPPREITWLLELCAERSTRVVRGRMRDNPTLDERAVDAAYASMDGTAEGARELDGKVVIGVDGALFDLDVLERDRVAEAPPLDAVVVSVDPAQSARKDADVVGVVAVGIAKGHLYVLESVSDHMTPEAWSSRAIQMADDHDAGRYVVESTGGGETPRALLDQAMRLTPGAPRLPIVESKARKSKADRAAPLSGAAVRGRVHLVGRAHGALERELTTWYPGAPFSPGAMDALVHGASVLTHQWRALE
jgi:phage terminase large subunit-like protein